MKAIDGLKICSHCKVEKPVSEYHKNKTKSDGYHNWCKDCLIGFRQNYKSKKQEYDKQYHLDNAEHKRQMASEWYYDNHKEAKETRKKYYENHPEIRKAYYQTEDYKVKHRKRAKVQKAKRRNLGFTKLFENFFPDDVDIDWHHLNDMLVIPIPKKVHNNCSHPNPEEHRERCNVWLYYLYGIDFDRVLTCL